MRKNLSQKVKQLSPLAVLFLVFAVCVGLWIILMTNDAMNIDGEDSSWDLRNINLSDTSVRLQGDVEYIPNALLRPEEFSNRESEALFGSIEGFDTITSRIRIYLPDDVCYTFSRLLSGYSHRLYVNGEWLLDVGIPGECREVTRSDTTRITFTTRPVDGVVELVQQSATFLHRWDTLPQHWYVGSQNLVSDLRITDFVLSLIMGCFLALFLIYIMLYVIQRAHIATLYFALLSLTLFIRSGILGSSIVWTVVPWLDCYTKFRIEYFAVPILAWLLIAVIGELLPWLLHKYYRIVVHVTMAAFALVFLFANITIMSQAMVLFYICCVAHTLYVFFRVAKKLRKINLEQGILLTGFLSVVVTVLYSLNYYSGIQLISFYVTQPFVSMIVNVYFCFSVATAVFISNAKATEAAKIAEQKLAVEVDSLARLNHMKTELMITISHESRTSLAVLASYSGLVAMELKHKDGSARMISDLNKIVEEAKRVANLIDSMNKLTLGGKEPEARIHLNLSELIEQTAGLYRHIFERDKVKMELAIEDGLFVFASSEKLTQVLFNLLQNAKDHTAQGKVSVIAKKEHDNIVVTVSDTGAGIPSEMLPHLFERGVSGTAFGSGIGLAICKEIIEAYNGRITIESELIGQNKGTRATFILPVATEEDESGTG